VVGLASNKAELGGGPIKLAEGSEQTAFVARFDASGAHQWSKHFGLGAYGVAQAPDGGVVVAGDFGGTVDFGGGPLKAIEGGSMFVVKLDDNGKHLWSKSFAAGGRAVAIDHEGNVLLTGPMNRKVDFGGGAIEPTVSASMMGPITNTYLVKLDRDGGHVWSKRFGSIMTSGTGVAVDRAGNVVVVGMTKGQVDFGKGALGKGNDWGLFVAKYGPTGEHLWGKVLGGADPYASVAAACDAQGNVALAGSFWKGTDLGGGPLPSKGGASDVFVAKLDPSGGHLWSKAFGGKGAEKAEAIALGAGGELAVAGLFEDVVDLGGGPLRSAGKQDAFVAKYGPTGAHLMSKRLGGPEWDGALGVALDAAGTLVVAGRFKDKATLDGGPPLSSAGDADAFLVGLGR
jgi:hypothetical protein